MDFKAYKKKQQSNKGKSPEFMGAMSQAGKSNFNDERFWYPSPDKAGNAEALIRFLPLQDDTQIPESFRPYHNLNIKGKKFFSFCPLFVLKDRECPICDFTNQFWDSSKKKALTYYKSKQWITNILVIKDTGNPENNGKMFLYKYGVKLREKILDKCDPQGELDDPVNVYDLWEGLNFKLKVGEVDGQNNYDKSQFVDTCTPVSKSEKGIEKVFNKINDLTEFTAEKEYKSHEELTKKFNNYLKSIGETPMDQTSSDKAPVEEDSGMGDDVEFGETDEMDDGDLFGEEEDGSESLLDDENDPEDEEVDDKDLF